MLDAIGGKGKLYDLFDKLKGGHKGEAPVIKCIGFKPIQNMNGVSQQPLLEIVDWVEWSEELPQETISELRGDDANTDYSQEPSGGPAGGGGAAVAPVTHIDQRSEEEKRRRQREQEIDDSIPF